MIWAAILSLSANAELADGIDAQRMKRDVETLAAFHTRNTLSPTLEKAVEWIANQYRAIPGMQVEIMRYTLPKGRRVPEEKEVTQVIATLPGEDERIVMVGGHLDSLNLNADPNTGRAPGANDDASGTVLALELARVMAAKKWKHTLKFVAFTGEEQGLLGSRALAARAKTEKWKVDAFLNNDTVGSSENKNGQKNTTHVRIFSEEKDTHNSRELARYIEFITRQSGGFGVKLVFRKDRFGRGGDHSPFNDEGFSAVRFVEVHEEYSRQHTADDLPEHMDFVYLANVARINLLAMAAIANAGLPPEDVRILQNQSHDTTLTWKSTQGVKYVVYYRDTASPVWEKAIEVGDAARYTIPKVNKDDHVFAVAALGGVPVVAK